MLVPRGSTAVDRGWWHAKDVRGCSLMLSFLGSRDCGYGIVDSQWLLGRVAEQG
jgi:hypothetical protein